MENRYACPSLECYANIFQNCFIWMKNSEIAENSLKVLDPLMNIFSEGLELIVKLIAPLISGEEERENWLKLVDNLEASELEAEEAMRAEIEEQQQRQLTIKEQFLRQH